jgi:hypothetical protein
MAGHRRVAKRGPVTIAAGQSRSVSVRVGHRAAGHRRVRVKLVP